MTKGGPSAAVPVAVIVGSAWSDGLPWPNERLDVGTPFGPAVLHRVTDVTRPAYVLARHGIPHTLYPQQIPYKAHAWALRAAGVRALLVTSSVGILRQEVPLNVLLDVGDLLWPENRLPDGSACTLGDGHLVVRDGLFHPGLRAQVRSLCARRGIDLGGPVVFTYAGGPRTKTPAENRYWAHAGADVNSMTLAPEVVLAAELGIPVAALVVGHKYSHPDIENPPSESLDASRRMLSQAVRAFLEEAAAEADGNQMYRF
jgi:purine nucleoside phosphorylase